MNTLRMLPILLSLIVISISCKDSPSSPNTVSSTHIWPLAIGNTWIFRTTDYDTLGNIVSQHIDTTVILADTIVLGEHWFRPNRNSSYFSNRTDGVYLLSPGNAPSLWLKYPCAIGDSILYTLEKIRVLRSVSDTITVSGSMQVAHRFDEHSTYFVNARAVHENLYFVPGIGEVRYEYCSIYYHDVMMRTDLISYSLR